MIPKVAVLKMTLRSTNKKTGEVVATYRTQDSCPKSCPLYHNGCYAEYGPGGGPFGIAKKFGDDNDVAVIERIGVEAPANAIVRHHVSGDLLNPQGEPDKPYIEELNELHKTRPDIKHIMYTHAWRQLSPSDLPWVVNASCETKEDIEDAIQRGYEAVVTVPDYDDPMVGTTVAGKKVIVCPEQTHENVTCASCKLCAHTRKSVVAFVTHGAGKVKATKAIQRRREDA